MTIKDHLRSLADKKPPASPEPTSDEPVSTADMPSHVNESLVTIAADERQGRGFVVDSEGKIATNFHLVNSAGRIKVTRLSGDIFLGKVIRTDESRDLAVIQIPTKTPQYLTLGDTSAVDVGEDVFVLDNVSGASANMSKAVISALRVIGGTSLIQVDRPVDPSNSGSPFLTAQGTVVGIASYRMGQAEDTAGLAVSVKELKAFMSGQ